MQLQGRTVLITGAARGMGRMEALAFARRGCRLVVTDVDAEALSGTAAEVEGVAPGVVQYAFDVSDRSACLEAADEVVSRAGPVDVLVNNAGVTVCKPVLELTEAEARRMMDVNYYGMLWMMQAFVPSMLSRGSGHVVNMCSSAGKMGVPRLGGYCATKFAAIGITDTIRPELKRSGVRFTIVNPGYVDTGMFSGSQVPFITRWQQPDTVAEAIVRAVEKNYAEICVPRFAVRFATFMRGLCVPRFTDPVNAILGGHDSFDEWRPDECRPF